MCSFIQAASPSGQRFAVLRVALFNFCVLRRSYLCQLQTDPAGSKHPPIAGCMRARCPFLACLIRTVKNVNEGIAVGREGRRGRERPWCLRWVREEIRDVASTCGGYAGDNDVLVGGFKQFLLETFRIWRQRGYSGRCQELKANDYRWEEISKACKVIDDEKHVSEKTCWHRRHYVVSKPPKQYQFINEHSPLAKLIPAREKGIVEHLPIKIIF